jgi:hypothetical protein
MCGLISGRRHGVASGCACGRLSCSGVGVCNARWVRVSRAGTCRLFCHHGGSRPCDRSLPCSCKTICVGKAKVNVSRQKRHKKSLAPIISTPVVPVAITRYIPRNFPWHISDINNVTQQAMPHQSREDGQTAAPCHASAAHRTHRPSPPPRAGPPPDRPPPPPPYR